MTRDLAGDMLAEAKALRRLADRLEENAHALLSMQAGAVASGMLKEGQLIRKPTTWKPADDIAQILERGAKTMRRNELIQVLVENKLVGGDGADDPRRHQYANEAIRRGLLYGYLSENGDGTVHWVPGKRKSRVRKKL